MPLDFDHSGDTLTLRLSGDWSIDQVAQVDVRLRQIAVGDIRTARVDCTALQRFDLAPAWLVRNFLLGLHKGGATIEFVGERPGHFAFIDDISQSPLPATRGERRTASKLQRLTAELGKAALIQAERSRLALEFYGRVIMTGLRAAAHPKRLRLASVTRHVYETGMQAVPIVALIAFLITVVIAYIGAQQLERFGAEIFTVDLVAVGVLREMGVLLTAIIVAGRSGSAFAAEIGVMQLNDEVDALKSIGLDPYEVLVLPRVLGLVIALPLLTILADAMGLVGGALLCSWLLDISFPQFIARVQDALAPTTFWAGFLKAPAFAFLIAMTGTYRGMQVRDSSRELGRLTTVAVVQSIFLVILANAIFAILYLELDF
jgi:phospholipid/cholesterol/gamma-HCH transport system permease protein